MSISIPAKGWRVEIDHPDTGHTWTPTVVDANRNPTANGYPRIEITVKKDDKWRASAFEDAEMRVWKDGVRQPIDQLENVDETRGDGENQMVLSGRGALELEQRVRLEVDEEPVADTVERVVDKTAYVPDIDELTVGESEDGVLVATADVTDEWTDLLTTIKDTDPLEVNDGLDLLQTSHLNLARQGNQSDSDNNTGSFIGNVSNAEGQEVYEIINSGDYIEWETTTDYKIPEDGIQIAVRNDTTFSDGSNSPTPDVKLNGQKVDVVAAGGDFDWYFATVGAVSTYSGDLPAGKHTIRVEQTSDDDQNVRVDAVALTDSRYPRNFADDTDSNDLLPTPEDYVAATIETEDRNTTRAIDTGHLDSSWNDTTGEQQVALSDDSGANFETANNTTTLDAGFGTESTSLRARLRLDGYGTSGSSSPTTGFNAQSVDTITLTADVTPRAIIADRTFDGSAMSVLQELANVADGLFEFRRGITNPQSGFGYNFGENFGEAETTDADTILFSQPGIRTTDRQDPISSYKWSKTTEEVAKTVIVEGSAQRVREESFTADHGAAVALDKDNLQLGKEAVFDPSTGTEYQGSGVDYVLNAQPGEIVVQSDGDISDGQSLAISYSWKPRGSETNTNVSGKEVVEQIPQVVSERAAEQVARQILADVDEPLIEVKVIIPSERTKWNIVDAVNYDEIPGDSYEIRDIQTADGKNTLILATRETLDAAVATIQNRLQGLSDRV